MSAHTLNQALTQGAGIERSFLCPVHGDSRPSASVNVTTGLWFCYTCGAKGKAGEGEYEVPLDALEELARELGKSYSPIIYSESWLSQYDAGPIHPYWKGRFTEAAVRHFRLGYDLGRDAVTYPFRDANRHVLGVVRRPLGAEGGPKYLYPRGLKVSDYLFNYSPDVRRQVVLVEGAMDAVACWEAGIEAFAIYGARTSARQIQLIRRTGARQILCCFDADEAGQEAFERVHHEVTDMEVTQVRWHSSLGKDIAELPVQTRVNTFATYIEKSGEEYRVDACHSRSSASTRTLLLHGGFGRSRTTLTRDEPPSTPKS